MINLKKINVDTDYEDIITIPDRLPMHVTKAHNITCKYRFSTNNEFLLLHLSSQAKLEVICQRCLRNYTYDYTHNSMLALCDSESMAEKYLHQYETIAVYHQQVSLIELVTDELYLFVPEVHENVEHCDDEVHNYLINSIS